MSILGIGRHSRFSVRKTYIKDGLRGYVTCRLQIEGKLDVVVLTFGKVVPIIDTALCSSCLLYTSRCV